jgi:hypothetical protein
VKRWIWLASLLCVVGQARADAPGIGPVQLGGRAEHTSRIDRDAGPFEWNDATHSVWGRTRVMLDLAADSTLAGAFYIKGAAVWDNTRPRDVQKRFRFEQGDWLWARGYGSFDTAFRLFANERRFFVEDPIAPLLDDDAVAQSGDNLGVRLDGVWRGRLIATALFSSLGDDFDTARRTSYAALRYGAGPFSSGISYLLTDPGEFNLQNQAVIKVDAGLAWRWTYVMLAYQQSGFSERNVFLPAGRFDGGESGLTAALPAGGAVSAEVRATSIDVTDAARLRLVYRYDTAGGEFVNDVGWNHGARVAHTASAYMQAVDVDLNGRLRYHNSERFIVENEERDVVEGSVWGALRNGLWFTLRGAVARIEDGGPDADRNFVHFGLERRIRELRPGAHVMWRDAGNDFSQWLFAVDGRLPISPNWALYVRALAGRDFAVTRSVYGRLEYRPSDRIFATFSYGREEIGDDPYLIEDPDLDLARNDTIVYRISIRGDF